MRLRSAILASALVLMAATQVSAQNRIRIIFGYPAGDTADSVIRLVADRMSKELGTTVITENMAGASGRIGTKPSSTPHRTAQPSCIRRWPR